MLQDTLVIDQRIPSIAIMSNENKVIQTFAVSARIESGQVFIPEEAPWLDEFRREVLAFPNSRFDDQVDSMSQYLTWLSERAPFVLNVSLFTRAAMLELGTNEIAPWHLFPTGNY